MAGEPTRSSEQSPPPAPHITEEAVFDQLVEDEDRILVDFHADWCGPCQLMAPTVDELATESDAAIVKVDVEKLPQVASRYDVQSIPTFLVFHDGDAVARLVGMQEKHALEERVE